ncbi:MAG: hypothetical protein MUC99_03940 [Anaerolineae bacterium]|nr:hypothetical protein [Anaerolineae bacterium]
MSRFHPLLFALLGAVLAACASAPPPDPIAITATLSPTLVASSTPTPDVTVPPSLEPPTPTPSLTPLPTAEGTPATLSPTVLTDLEAPIRLRLPDGWRFASDALLLPGAEGMSVVPFSLYQGDITGGQGTILVLWAFESVVPAAPTGSPMAGVNLYADGLRMLLFAVVEAECNLAYDEERVFSVGGIEGRGTFFAADDCPGGLPSLRGWFSAFTINRLNFAFYAYTEPKELLDGPALEELQAILNSVEFDFGLLPTPAPTSLPVQIVSPTPDPQAVATRATPTTPPVVFATATPAP